MTPHDYDSARKLTFKKYLNVAINGFQNYLLAAGFTVLTFIVRIFILILSMPLILLAIFVGFNDGLVKRDIRRFIAGHESSFIYHRAKVFIMPTITLPRVVYLALLINISPLLVMLPYALLNSIIMNIAAASVKKYL